MVSQGRRQVFRKKLARCSQIQLPMPAPQGFPCMKSANCEQRPLGFLMIPSTLYTNVSFIFSIHQINLFNRLATSL
jgi:hypothetical protein